MPQTSLLSFLGSSVTGTYGSLPALKTNSAPLRRYQDDLRPKDVSVGMMGTYQLPPKSPKPVDLTSFNDDNGASSLRRSRERENATKALSALRNGKEEGRQEIKDPTRTIVNHLSTTLRQNSETALNLPHCPSITITSIQPDHLPALKRLTSSLLPIKYPDPFYADAISDPTAATLSRIALYTPFDSNASIPPIPIGWIRCSLEPYPEATSPPQSSRPIYNRIYIKALCLLAPYRHMGVAAALLDSVLQQNEVLREHNALFVFAHVWESNEEALEWYEKRGFGREGLVEAYYRKLRPSGAWVVRKEV